MNNTDRPALPIPPPLRGADRESGFAYYTVTERLPRIAREVLAVNGLEPVAIRRLEQLLAEMPDAPVRLLQDTTAADTSGWVEYVAPYLDENWLTAPWFFVENYFYRRILEATGYFQAGPGLRQDPFAAHKQRGLKEAWPAITGMVEQASARRGEREQTLEQLLLNSLWGNQGDLSMWPGGADEAPDRHNEAAARDHLLVNDIQVAVRYLLQVGRMGPVHIAFLLDNAGIELAGDLLLVDALLADGWAEQVTLHAKMHPTFVSDVTQVDLKHLVTTLMGAESPAVRDLGERLRTYQIRGQLTVEVHPFWTSPLEGWQLPADLRGSLSQTQLVISKGDMNYRRLLGDRHWAYTAPFSAIVNYFPAPLLALRTLKSEVAAGLQAEQVARLETQEPGWMTAGTWGVAQFAPPEAVG